MYSFREFLSLRNGNESIIRTNDNVVGDLRGSFLGDAFTVSLEAKPNSDYDSSSDDTKCQVKERKCYKNQDNIWFVAIKDLPKDMFDYLALILFDDCLALRRALYMPREVAKKLCMHLAHINSDMIRINLNTINQMPGVEDVTAQIAQTWANFSKNETLTNSKEN